jgi:hypothetical protein
MFDMRARNWLPLAVIGAFALAILAGGVAFARWPGGNGDRLALVLPADISPTAVTVTTREPSPTTTPASPRERAVAAAISQLRPVGTPEIVSATLDHLDHLMCGILDGAGYDSREVWAVVVSGTFRPVISIPAGATPPAFNDTTFLVVYDAADGTMLTMRAPWPPERDASVTCN